MKKSGYDPGAWIESNPELESVVEMLEKDVLVGDEFDRFRPLVDALRGEDRYFCCADFGSYVERQKEVAAAYRDRVRWSRMSIRNVAGMGIFSSDRTVAEYAREIWGALPIQPEA